MKKILLALICTMTLAGNAFAGIAFSCEEIKEELKKIKQEIDSLNLEANISAKKTAELQKLKNQEEELQKEFYEQGCK